MLYKSNIAHKSDFKPLRSDSYALSIVDTKTGYFIITDLSTGQQSHVFKDTMGEEALIISYACFKDCHNDGEKYFNSLCREFIENDNNLTINR